MNVKHNQIFVIKMQFVVILRVDIRAPVSKGIMAMESPAVQRLTTAIQNRATRTRTVQKATTRQSVNAAQDIMVMVKLALT
jgi:hypothetical protein